MKGFLVLRRFDPHTAERLRSNGDPAFVWMLDIQHGYSLHWPVTQSTTTNTSTGHGRNVGVIKSGFAV